MNAANSGEILHFVTRHEQRVRNCMVVLSRSSVEITLSARDEVSDILEQCGVLVQRVTSTWHSPKRPPFCVKLLYYLSSQREMQM